MLATVKGDALKEEVDKGDRSTPELSVAKFVAGVPAGNQLRMLFDVKGAPTRAAVGTLDRAIAGVPSKDIPACKKSGRLWSS